MGFRDFSLLFAVCFVWGLNIVVTRWVVFDAGVPPVFFAAVRFLGVAVLLIPFLRPVPKDIRMLFLISFFIGAGHSSGGCGAIGRAVFNADEHGVSGRDDWLAARNGHYAGLCRSVADRG